MIYLVEDVRVDSLGDLVRDEALPLVEPVRADDVPMLATCSVTLVVTIQLDVQDDLFFNFPAKFKGIDLVSRDPIRPM